MLSQQDCQLFHVTEQSARVGSLAQDKRVRLAGKPVASSLGRQQPHEGELVIGQFLPTAGAGQIGEVEATGPGHAQGAHAFHHYHSDLWTAFGSEISFAGFQGAFPCETCRVGIIHADQSDGAEYALLVSGESFLPDGDTRAFVIVRLILVRQVVPQYLSSCMRKLPDFLLRERLARHVTCFGERPNSRLNAVEKLAGDE